MQGQNVATIDVRDKIQDFQTKLDLWSRRVQTGIYANFQTFHDWKAAMRFLILKSRYANTLPP